MAMNREELECIGDAIAPADFYLYPICHPVAPMRVRYRIDGILVIECDTCDAVVAEVYVASRKLIDEQKETPSQQEEQEGPQNQTDKD